MDKTKQKNKKEKPNKNVDKEKSPSFMADVKTLKENLKIREILRTVKMNSSMRIKAPRGSKVMHNKDFNDTEDIFEGSSTSSEGHDLSETPSATNPLVVNNNVVNETSENDCTDDDCTNKSSQTDLNEFHENIGTELDTSAMQKSKSLSEGLEDSGRDRVSTLTSPVSPTLLPPLESPLLRTRERKLSLDHTMLSKRESLSQSEVDLHLIGKSPLERKSSFFRKKMDSFLKNTTEIFKRQSLGNKSSLSVQRSGSTCSRMSVSMQSLNENEAYSGNYEVPSNEELRGSITSLQSSVTPARSNSSLSASQSDRIPLDHSEDDSLLGSRPKLDGSQPIENMPSTSTNDLSDSCNQESFLHSRAISMSSGLDSAHRPRKRKTSRSNRVTWVASESLTDYFRRLIQDEKTREMQGCHSYQDFSTIPENTLYGTPRTDSKGRRLSYQRAVSGEDPVLPTRYQDTTLRRKKIAETSEGNSEISACLAEFSRSGIPELVGFQIRAIPDDAYAYLLWAEVEKNLEDHYEWKTLCLDDEGRQSVIKELIQTEVDYIRHLTNIVEIYIATAHALQDMNQLLDLETSRLFLNIPDILNANMKFWELVMYPMIADSFKNNSVFLTDLMAQGFAQFAEIFEPYEEYVCGQAKAVDYLRSLTANPEFMAYLTWCNNRNPSNRLQLADILVKPMQRLTKYSILIRRIITFTKSEESKIFLDKMEAYSVQFLHRVNRAIRQKEEIEKLENIQKYVDPYDVDFKDEDLDKYFHMFNEVNLKAPMVNCDPDNSRTLVYQGDLRFRDHAKETEVRAILFTDMLLICKKITKGGQVMYKMIRPKYMLERLLPFFRFNPRTNPQEVTGLIYVVMDDHSTAVSAFCLSEPPKDPNPVQTLKNWELKIREARVAYELSTWFHRHPVKDLSEVEADYCSEIVRKEFPDDYIVERRARERVAAMLHPNRRPSTGQEVTTIHSDTFEPGRGPPNLRHPFHRTSTGGSSRLSSFHQSTSSRNSRLSSFQQSASAASHDDPLNVLKYLYKAGSSVEHLIPPQNPDDVVRSITVNVVSESECETVVPSRQPTPPAVVLQQSSPSLSPGLRSASAGGSQNTLRVSPQHSITLVHSLPDLTIEQIRQHQPSPPPIQQSASEKLYQSHQNLLQRNRLAASHHHQYLSPDQRGSSYPPPSPTRGSLRRGMAFSYSFKNPPLSKMGHVFSQSQVQIDQPHTSTSQPKVENLPVAPQEPPETIASTSTDNEDKRKPTRSKTKSSSADPPKVDKSIQADEPPRDMRTKKGKSDKDCPKVKSDESRTSDKENGYEDVHHFRRTLEDRERLKS